jgi:hypothetical protein
MTAQKQLNIRSTAAYETAHRLARRLGKTTQQVVIEALEEKAKVVGDRDADPPPEVVEERIARLRALSAELLSSKGPPLHDKSDDDWLYDENGVPH